MEPLNVVTHGCPAPVVEALGGYLATSGLGTVLAHDAEVDAGMAAHMVRLVYCDGDDRWAQLAELSAAKAEVVAMIVELDIDHYARALVAGAGGVIHFDTPAATMVSVMQAALRGEVVLPAFAGHSLAAAWTSEPAPSAISDYEVGLLEALSEGRPIQDVAKSTFYSDRTIRRHLQSLYLKLGANNRNDALNIAMRANLI